MTGLLPNSWCSVAVTEIADSVTGNTPSTKDKSNYGGYIPYIKPPQLENKLIDTAEEFLSEKGAGLARILPANSVLVSCIGNIGRVALNTIPVAFNQQINALVLFEGILPKFIFYQAQSYNFRNQLEEMASATTISIVNKGNFEKAEIHLAPANEQQRIVAKIEALFSELDKGIEALKTAREQLKVYRQAVLKHAFEGRLTAEWREENNAESWLDTTFGNHIPLLTSGSRGWAKYYADKGDIFIRAQNLKYDRLDLDDIAYVKLPEKSEGMRTKVQIDDLLITITGANVTKTAIVDKDIGNSYVSQHVALCRLDETVESDFLYWYLIAETAGRKQLKEFAYGAGKPGLNLDNIRSITLRLPGKDEQKQIVKRIKEQLSLEENAESVLDIEIRRTETLRQSILKKAFSGQLVPQDPKDEPASALLERIRAEQARQTQPTRKTRRKKTA